MDSFEPSSNVNTEETTTLETPSAAQNSDTVAITASSDSNSVPVSAQGNRDAAKIQHSSVESENTSEEVQPVQVKIEVIETNINLPENEISNEVEESDHAPSACSTPNSDHSDGDNDNDEPSALPTARRKKHKKSSSSVTGSDNSSNASPLQRMASLTNSLASKVIYIIAVYLIMLT